MSIVLIIFWFDVLAAFICAATERFFLCGVCLLYTSDAADE